jgi:hypothetical protein
MSTQTEVRTDPVREVFDELFTLLETLETNNAAVLQFLQDQGIGGEKLAPYLERAGNASNVKMRAARKRMEYLLTPIHKESAPGHKEEGIEKEQEKEKREAKSENGAKAENENKSKGKEEKEKDDEAEKRGAEPAQSEVPSEKPPADKAAANESAETSKNTPRPQERAQQ